VKSTSLNSRFDDEQVDQLNSKPTDSKKTKIVPKLHVELHTSESDQTAGSMSREALSLAESVGLGVDNIYQNDSQSVNTETKQTNESDNIYEDISDSAMKELPSKQAPAMLSVNELYSKVKQPANSEAKSQKASQKAARKVSRKESARVFKRKQKSFRNRVYEVM
jgi:hypothetical protein